MVDVKHTNHTVFITLLHVTYDNSSKHIYIFYYISVCNLHLVVVNQNNVILSILSNRLLFTVLMYLYLLTIF